MNLQFSTLQTTLEDHILTITINRPEKLNALNKDVFNDLDQAMDEVYSNSDIKAVIITGSGSKAFVAGADIAEFTQLNDTSAKEMSAKGQRIFFKIEDCKKPVIAAVNGFALGGGCELAMACHFRLASENAKFGQPEVNLGLIPGYGGTQRLSLLIGKSKAMELVMTGEMISANDALHLGLVNYVTSPEELLPKTKQILATILIKSPVAVGYAIEAVNRFDHTRAGFDHEVELFKASFASDDCKEGTAAFLEKRKPNFNAK